MASNADKIILTESQLDQLEEMAKIRLPHWQMAALLKINPNTFNDVIRRDDRAQHRLMTGRAKGSNDVRLSLYAKSMGERDPNDPTKWLYQPDFAALKFWCLTQEGFKMDHSIEVNINSTQELSQDDKSKEIARLLALRALEHDISKTDDDSKDDDNNDK